MPRLIARHLAGSRRVLDVGCGEGQIARRVAAADTLTVGVDPTAAQIVEIAKRRDRISKLPMVINPPDGPL